MKPLYDTGQRVAFIARNECVIDGKRALGKWSHIVGYVKQVRRSLLGAKYVVCKSKSDEIYIVPQRDVLGLVEKREFIIKQDGD